MGSLFLRMRGEALKGKRVKGRDRAVCSQDSRRAERAGRLLECLLERARGCGERPELWRVTRSVVQQHCPGWRASQEGTGTAQRDSPGDSSGSAPGTVSPGPCDKIKARELMAVWRSYNNLG